MVTTIPPVPKKGTRFYDAVNARYAEMLPCITKTALLAFASKGYEARDEAVQNVADAAVTEKGRELLRQSLESIIQTEIDDIEKKRSRDSVHNVRRSGNTSATAVKPSEPPTES